MSGYNLRVEDYTKQNFSKIKNSNHFFKNKEKELRVEIEKYLKEKTALI